jgi:feruloyl esterase
MPHGIRLAGFRFAAVLLLSASSLSTQPSAPMSCPALRSLTGYEFSVASAELQPAAGNTPEFCRVLGQVQPDIRFEIALPTAWNKRLFTIGNGGYAGENLETPGRVNARNEALRKGFAFAQHNTGHDAAEEPLATFAVNSQKVLDYGFRAMHVTVETARKLTEAFYGAAPFRSYYDSCSTGGRQALIAAQRFPRDLDGIVCGAPVLDFTGTMLKYVSWAQATAAAPVPYAKLKLLSDRVYAQCDAKDGLQDGLIDDPRRCGFDPARDLPRCASTDAPDCFTEGEIRSLQNLYGDLVVKGKRLFPGWPVGAEVAGSNGRSGWDMWLVREKGPTIGFAFAESFFRYMAYPKKDPKLELTSFDFDRDPPRLDYIAKVLNATDTDLAPFRDRGGKLLMWYGWADQALNPMMGVEYYEAVVKRMGPSTKDFFRLFMMPGVFHCGGGVGCSSFDRLAAIMDWVERGKPPEGLVATRTEKGKLLRSRPLCAYPQVAKYKGSGSIDDAANFVCANPE